MKNILSLDGGGIRGIIPAVVLTEIEQRAGKPIHQLFDLVAGTSTGGILTLGLLKQDGSGAAEYTAEDMLNLYIDEGADIFHRSTSRKINSLNGIIDEKYSHKNIERILKDRFGEVKLEESLSKALITSYDIKERSPYFFKSWHPENSKALMREAARATSAAPTFFEPALVKVEIDGKEAIKELVDGGVFVNNPVVSAYAEAMRIFPDDKDDINVVSIGTGELIRPIRHKDAKNWGKMKWIVPILDCMFDGVSDAADYQMGYFIGDRFFRFQVRLDNASDDMDDASKKNIQLLVEEGKRLVKANDSKLNQIVKLLGGS